jgi:2-amino-4-hydroxy-6-hydroxymethyldihydropteridine diphosphokinase
MPSKQEALIAMGGNAPSEAGSPAATILAAIEALDAMGLSVERVSALYDTPCFPAGAGPDFVNAAVAVRTALSPRQVLENLHDIEDRFGRIRARRWGVRTLDLDLLAMGGAILPDAETQAGWRALPLPEQTSRAPDRLILPHPRLQDRAFVLVPLADVAPDWRHPALGLTVRDMLARLAADDRLAVRPHAAE